MKIATWNVNGIRKREAEFLAWMGEEKPDIVCLQETKAAPEQLSQALLELPDYFAYWHAAAKGYSGVSLHIRKGLFPEAPRFGHPAFDAESRLVEARVGDLVLASVYVPNGGKDFDAKVEFLKAMASYAAELRRSELHLILCGDMNVARTDNDVHPKERKQNIIGQRPDERALFEAIIANGLTDVGRSLAPDDDRLFTWWPYWRNARQRNIGWRLDYVLASDRLPVASCVVRREVGTSDHAPVVCDIGR